MEINVIDDFILTSLYRISAKKMVNFLHLSDFHLPDKRGELHENIDPFQKLDDLIEYAEKLELNPSFTIITGDLSDTGTPQSYKHVKEYISKIEPIGGPVLPAMGNHDNRANFNRILLGNTSQRKDSPCYYSKTIEGIHIIVMDSHTKENPMGSFNEEQLDWLETELREHIDKPSVIACHQPIFFSEVGSFKLSDAIRFRKMVSKGNVLAVLNGHMHCPIHNVTDGVNYVQAGSSFEIRHFTDTGKMITYDSSSFNVVGYVQDYPNRLWVRPIFFSKGQQHLETTIPNR